MRFVILMEADVACPLPFQATKLYCFVHKVPVCGECICFTEHLICVVSAWLFFPFDNSY